MRKERRLISHQRGSLLYVRGRYGREGRALSEYKWETGYDVESVAGWIVVCGGWMANGLAVGNSKTAEVGMG